MWIDINPDHFRGTKFDGGNRQNARATTKIDHGFTA
ncbi:Uncharacterised protein [Vibrio cholerae]|nr:Uncharacterised protein [Vibrio cholerae]